MVSALDQAQALAPPTVTATNGGETEHLEFWNTHEHLLQDAWKEWEQEQDETVLPELTELSVLNSSIVEGVRFLWSNPLIANEKKFQALYWKEPTPGVYTCNNFLSEEGVRRIRAHLEAASQSGIPKRRPNGMNRHGLVLDEETQGGVTYSKIDSFRNLLVEEYIRPMGRMFFRDFIGSFEDDQTSYAFTIHYKGKQQPQEDLKNATDVKLNEHSDSSVVTFNINLNLPEEAEYGGSELLFLDEAIQKRHPIKMEPGMVVVHRGLHRHQALPIQQGERHQLVVWLMGRDGYVRFVPYEEDERMSIEERWSKPKDAKKGIFEL